MPDGTRYQLKIAVDDGYLFTVRQSVLNGSGKPLVVRPIGLVSRATKSADPDSWTNQVGPIGVFDDKANYDINWKDLDEKPAGEQFTTSGGWLGFTDKYWLTALSPAGSQAFTGSIRKSASGSYQADYAEPADDAGAGPDAVDRDAAVRRRQGVRASQAISGGRHPAAHARDRLGLFPLVHDRIYDLLVFLFDYIGNFGLAIIALTFIVRGIMFPIAQKQFQSMAAMRKLQPKMKAVQERFKDDKQRQQQEILKLYQAEKVNPAAGCLPIVLQIPVFYALYKVLLVSVEMRHQPFVLWIKDLSAPDPLTPVNLFGTAPFHPARDARDRRAADPRRRDPMAVDEAQPAADGPGPGADFRDHAVVPGVHHGALRGRASALLDDQQHPDDRAAMVAVPQVRPASLDTHPVHT